MLQNVQFPSPAAKIAGQLYFRREEIEAFKAQLLGIQAPAAAAQPTFASHLEFRDEMAALGFDWSMRTFRRRIASSRAAAAAAKAA